MTGHGDHAGQNERLAVTVEIRSVNNRHLKISLRCPESFVALESHIERVVRQTISRGTLNIQLRIRQLGKESSYQFNRAVAASYAEQAKRLGQELGLIPPAELASLLPLPGIVDEGDFRSVEESDWPLIEKVLSGALVRLQEFRQAEGDVMAAELASQCAEVERCAGLVAGRAPGVIRDYRERTISRVQELLQGTGVKLEETDLVREVSLFADRCDITEELMRLRSHLQQYRKLIQAEGSQGRKLEFLGQELFREVNTVGSKANDVEIAHLVVDMKAAVEKMREIIQNVE